VLDNRMVAKTDKRKIGEYCIVDGVKCLFDYDLNRNLTQNEIENGVVFNYDLEFEDEVE